MNSNIITFKDKLFPDRLRHLAQTPQALYYRGENLDALLQEPTLAIVGSRKVSPYGRSVTARLAHDLAQAGVTIVSGLALGVDSIAHTATLDADGKTVAVLPCGIDTVYPAQHYQLAKHIIASGGVLVSEYPGDLRPQKYQFIARNRIIAGLSRGILITEAAVGSGSLHTAEFALELGLEVFAVPGNITSQNSAGTNKLIKNGTTPVTCVEDILEALHITPSPATKRASNFSGDELSIITLLQTQPLDGQALQAHTKLKTDSYQQTMTLLEINGHIRKSTDGVWHLR